MGHYESPSYEVVQQEGEFELRRYESFYIVVYENDLDPEIQNGFGTLFAYIGSNNLENKKISMTVPVIEDVRREKKKMAFVVPRAFGENIPKPKSSNLKVETFEEGFYAVITYSGRATKSLENRKSEQLHRWVEEMGWTVVSNDKLAYYNAPFVPGFLRRNEVMVRVELASEIKKEQNEFKFVLTDEKLRREIIEKIKQTGSSNGYNQLNLAYGVVDQERKIFLTLRYYMSQSIKRSNDGVDDLGFMVLTDQALFEASCEENTKGELISFGITEGFEVYLELVKRAVAFYMNTKEKNDFENQLRQSSPELRLHRLVSQFKESF